MMGFNQELFLWLNELAGQWPVFDASVVFVAEYLGFALVGALLFFEWLKYEEGRKARARRLLMAVVVAGIIWAVASVLKDLAVHPRPFVALEDVKLLIPRADSGSFPSGHTAFAAALGGAMFALDRRVGVFLLISALLIGISRVIAGVHWPIDIVGGLLLGATGGWLICRLINIKKVIY
jgi:undecaprenyl-diphosphatase